MLMTLGEAEMSRREYQEVVDAVGDGSTLDADDLASVGWCHYALGNTDAAAAIYTEALYRDPAAVPTEFDAGLALIGGGRCSQGVRQFDRARAMLICSSPYGGGVCSRSPLRICVRRLS